MLIIFAKYDLIDTDGKDEILKELDEVARMIMGFSKALKDKESKTEGKE